MRNLSIGLSLAALFVAVSFVDGAISPDDPLSLQSGIVAACKAGEKKVVIPPGVYRIDTPHFALSFEEFHDFEIDATGVTLLRLDPTGGGVEFDRCHNVSLHGMTIIDQTPPFTQGVIEAIDPAGKFYDIRICDGFPADFDNPKHFRPQDTTGYIFDRGTRQWKAGTSDFWTNHVERLGEGKFRLYWPGGAKRSGGDGAVVGDEMAFRGNGNADLRLGRCDHMQISDVRIKNGGGFCIHESEGEGDNHYTRVTVTYGPRPANALEDPLIACNADAFHSNGMRHGPTLDDCHFEGMPDDGVAIHGFYALVMESDAKSVVVLFSGGNFLRPGDPIRWFDRKGTPRGEAVVQSVEPLKDYVGKPLGKRPNFRDSHHYYRLTLDRPLSAQFEDLLDDPAANGSHYIVRNCTIRNHRARGMLLKADDGLVENNTVDGSTMAGIVVSPELWWNEAGFTHNITIRGNTVRHVGYQNAGPWMGQAGAITVRGDDEKISRPAEKDEQFGHQHVVIENNTIEDCDGVNLLVSSASDVLIKNNKFVDAQQHPSRRGADHVDPGALIQIGPCKNVRIEGNTVVKRGPAGTVLIEAADPAQVTGIETGFTSKRPSP